MTFDGIIKNEKGEL